MNCRIVKLEKFSGRAASVYSVYFNEENTTLFDIFIQKNVFSFKSEISNIAKRLIAIGHDTGARINFFKDKEGKPGDGLCALYDKPGSKLRLYCIRYGNDIVILGGGGHKPKGMRSLQESEELKKQNYFLRNLSQKITERIKEGEISFSSDGLDLEGNLIFNDDDYE